VLVRYQSTLWHVQVFEIELIEWQSMNDLAPERDGSLMKFTIQEGDLGVWDKPRDVDIVKVQATACLAGSKEAFLDEEKEFTVSDGWLCPAVKLAVVTMKQGEEIMLKVRPARRWC
jgi:FK506-binding protein 4/5